jgi:hypothetical protein
MNFIEISSPERLQKGFLTRWLVPNGPAGYKGALRGKEAAVACCLKLERT